MASSHWPHHGLDCHPRGIWLESQFPHLLAVAGRPACHYRRLARPLGFHCPHFIGCLPYPVGFGGGALLRKRSRGWPPSLCVFRLHRSFVSLNDRDNAGLLECILTAGYWFPDRISEAYPHISAACPRCGFSPCGPGHTFWCCPANDAIDDDSIPASAHLGNIARCELLDRPSFWLRGLGKPSVIIPFPAVMVNMSFVGDAPW